MPRTGHCHCGEVKFTVIGEPVRMSHCHCNACRRTTGTGHNLQAFFKKDEISITGQTNSHDMAADSGNTRTRHFCPTCGSRLFSENSKTPDLMGISIGAFDNSDWFKPVIAVYSSERPVWDYVDPSLEQRELM